MEEHEAGVETEVSGAPQEQQELKDNEAGAPQTPQDEPDYKALLADALEREGNYKTALQQKRQFRKQAPSQHEEPEDDPNDIQSMVRKAVQEEVMPVITENKVQTHLEKMVTDPDKRKLVQHYYQTRIRQTGTSDDAIQSDLETAIAIADAPKIKKINQELARKNMQQKVPPMGGSSADRGVERNNHQFSQEQTKALEATARSLGADPKKFVEAAWKNQHRG